MFIPHVLKWQSNKSQPSNTFSQKLKEYWSKSINLKSHFQQQSFRNYTKHAKLRKLNFAKLSTNVENFFEPTKSEIVAFCLHFVFIPLLWKWQSIAKGPLVTFSWKTIPITHEFENCKSHFWNSSPPTIWKFQDTEWKIWAHFLPRKIFFREKEKFKF